MRRAFRGSGLTTAATRIVAPMYRRAIAECSPAEYVDMARALVLVTRCARKDNGAHLLMVGIGAALGAVLGVIGDRFYGNQGVIAGAIIGISLAVPIALQIDAWIQIKNERKIERLIAENPAHWRPIFAKARKAFYGE